MIKLALVSVFITILFSCSFGQGSQLAAAGERRLQNVKQLTTGGENAEAYFSLLRLPCTGSLCILDAERSGRDRSHGSLLIFGPIRSSGSIILSRPGKHAANSLDLVLFEKAGQKKHDTIYCRSRRGGDHELNPT